MTYMVKLPDPVNKIMDSGLQDNSNGTAGPGFASVQLSSVQPTMGDRTNGARYISRSLAKQHWTISINYNPLTRDEFEPVNSFLMSRQGSLLPFFVTLPQYSTTRNLTFFTYAQSNDLSVVGLVPSGSTRMLVDGFTSASGSPRPGDMFNIVDSFNSNHVKAYMVTRVETAADHSSVFTPTDPTAAQRVVHFNPPLTYETQNNSVVDFTESNIRVVQTGDTTEYSLGVNGLYNFSLKLEEALP